MKTNSIKNNIDNNEEKIHRKLRGINFNKIAYVSRFIKRKAKKITPKNFFVGFLIMSFSSETNSFELWASKIAILIKDTVSKQAVCKKINDTVIVFLKGVLEVVLNRSLFFKTKQYIKGFKNIYIQDSTSIKLNGKLSKYYPGNENKFKKIRKSILKIHTIYNIAKRSFSSFQLSGFRENDQSKSKDIMELAKPGDLVLRDLGYFILEVFKEMIEEGIYFLSRLKARVNLYEKDSLEKLNLLKLLKNKESLDIDVLLGTEDKLPVRLVAIKLDEKAAVKRKRKAKKDRDRRLNHSKEYMMLLGWVIYISNVPRERLSLKQIIELYKIRWRIEIIIKCWKSYFQISEVLGYKNNLRVESYIYCMLIFIVLFEVEYFIRIDDLSEAVNSSHKEEKNIFHSNISMMKFSKFISSSVPLFLLEECNLKNLLRSIDKQILYYCSYQTRNDRLNFYEKLQILS